MWVECLRLILEAIYEPDFQDNSHGFRPGRSGHTALGSFQHSWTGIKWVIKLDISACSDNVDHSRLLNHCAICGSTEHIEMHHVRHIRKHGERVQGFTLYLAAINRKQIPVCRKCHRDIHNGRYDGASLADILGQIEAAPR